MVAQGGEGRGARWLAISVGPALVGWAALLLEPAWGLALLIGAFASVLVADHRAVAGTLAPVWWLRLRLPVTAAVVLGLAATWLASTTT